jgi:hypothetical protein
VLRPRVKDLVFHLYSRPIHPELFETCALHIVKRPDFEIAVRITPSGHVFSFRGDGFTVTEATAVRNQALPVAGHLLKHGIHGAKCDALTPAPQARYCLTTEIEHLTDDLFPRVQEEIIAGAAKGGLLFCFHPENRIFLSPISFMSVQAGPGRVSITGLHTFPGENTIVKTISLLERANPHA